MNEMHEDETDDDSRGNRGGRSAHSGRRPRRGQQSAGFESPDASRSFRKVKKSRPAKLRIIAGDLRGRSVQYHGDEYTRPMRDKVRENLFNILGTNIRSSECIDLFAGTGALAFESISRGAAKAIAVERSKHAAGFLRSNADTLGVADRLSVVVGDAFRMASTFLGPPPSDDPENDTPRIVFLCPPYAMWRSSLEDLNRIITMGLSHCSPGSVLVAETDKHFDVGLLATARWDHRLYGNTRLSFVQPELVCGLSD